MIRFFLFVLKLYFSPLTITFSRLIPVNWKRLQVNFYFFSIQLWIWRVVFKSVHFHHMMASNQLNYCPCVFVKCDSNALFSKSLHVSYGKMSKMEKVLSFSFFRGLFFVLCHLVVCFFCGTYQSMWHLHFRAFKKKKQSKQIFFSKFSLLLRSRLLSNTVHSQLKTTAWLLPERHGSPRYNKKGSYVRPAHSHRLP